MQAPPVQLAPEAQALLQEPQCASVVFGSTQPEAPQAVCPATPQAQTPLLHNTPAPQELLHMPQWLVSTLVSTQVPLQSTVPAPHPVHAPLMHC